MTIVERNDVDISKLFQWRKEIEITGIKEKKIKIYLRLLGDSDMNRARVMALRKSAEFRKLLRSPDSDERLAFIPDEVELDKDVIVESVIIYTMRDITKRAVKEVFVPKPKDPGPEASTEKLEKYQEEIDNFPKVQEKVIGEFITKRVDERRKELSEKSKEELYKIYVDTLINELCEQELLNRFKELCIYFGSYSDKKYTTKFFNEIEDVYNLPTEIKDQIMEQYQLLEVEHETLKK